MLANQTDLCTSPLQEPQQDPLTARQMRTQTSHTLCRCKSTSRRLRASSEPDTRRLLSSRMPSSRTLAQGAIRPPSLPGDACTLSACSCSQVPASVHVLPPKGPLERKRCYPPEPALRNILPCLRPWLAIFTATASIHCRSSGDTRQRAARQQALPAQQYQNPMYAQQAPSSASPGTRRPTADMVRQAQQQRSQSKKDEKSCAIM